MKIRRPLALFLTILILGLFSPTEGRPNGRFHSTSPRPHYAPGELLVKYRHNAASAIASSVSLSSATVKRKYAGVNIHHLKLPAKASVEEALRTFANDPSVEYAEPNYLRYAASSESTIPNDSLFPNLWGLHNTGQIVKGVAGAPGADIHASEAWDITKGNGAVIVAVIDSGVDYNHPDLAGNISPGLRYDFVNNDANPMDANDHGTHVTGTIAAVGNNSTGVTGVSWTATIMPLRAGNASGVMSVSDVISAIDYAVNNGAKVINASFGGSNYSQAEYNALDNARKAGILVVTAAGNEASDIDSEPVYPASYRLDNIIAVAATDRYDNLASFSNYGAGSVHVAAPGVNIYSTKPARRDLWSTDLDSGSMNGWTTGGTNNTWGLSSLWAYSGGYSLAVNPAVNYANGSNSWAQAPRLDLATAMGSKLTFAFTGNSESNHDFLYVETSTDGSAWTNRTVYVTNSAGSYIGSYAAGISGDKLSGQWYKAIVDLGNHDGQSTVHVRFRFTSDNNGIVDSGWFIDSIAVSAASANYSGSENQYYQYMSGTSMATPHVAGLAALIWGFKPGLTYTQVKDIIMNSVDANSSLAGKTLSGGRVNALRALYYVTPQAPVSLAATASSTSAISLTWSKSSLNESGFHIERRTENGGYALVSTADKDSTAYSDSGLSTGTTYCYRIASFNDGGNSDYTNEACATAAGAIGSGQQAVSGGADTTGGGGGGGCFIATAAFGSPMEGQVHLLREFRDRYLLKCRAGALFVDFYYRTSPPIADVISTSTLLRAVTRWCLMPLVGAAYLLVQHGPVTTSVVLLALALTMALFVRSAYKYRRLSRRKMD